MSKLSSEHIKRIAVFRALNLGDLLCAMPAMRALRHRFSRAEITLIGLPAMAEIAQRFRHYFDAFTSFPGAPGLPEQTFQRNAFTDFLHREAAQRYDVVVQMHGKGSITNPVVAMLGAGRIAGYFEPGEYCPDEELFIPYPDNVPEVDRHLRLMEFLGCPAKGRALEFPIDSEDEKSADNILLRHGLNTRQFACIHPGARDMKRWWEPGKFASVADGLARRGMSIVFTGTSSEQVVVERVRRLMKHPSISLAGKTDIGTLGALIARADILVSNDTGVSHIAAATCTPSVIIFLASDPERWAPLEHELHQVVLPKEADNAGLVLRRAESLLGPTPRQSAQ